jgi:hypothetical protein
MKTAEAKTTTESSHSWNPGVQNEPFFTSAEGERSSFFGPDMIQPKLKIGAPDDKYEKQADRVADRVVQMPDSGPGVQMQGMEEEEMLQTQPMEEEEPIQMQEEEEVQAKLETNLQTKCEACAEEESLQMKEINSSNPTDQIGPRLDSKKGSGSHMSNSVQNELSNKMGADFSNVNIHTDPEAIQMNQSLGARAFTHGNDIYFNQGEYNPSTPKGKHLLAHELTHVIQQKGSNGLVQRVPSYGAAAPGSPNWQVVPNDQRDRVNAAIRLIGNVVANNRCITYFQNNCTDGRGANSLQHAYDNAVIYNLNTNDNTYGSSRNGTNDIAYNNTTYGIGRWFLASTLLHEMFHTCDPTIDAQDEIDAENAVEMCRLYSPILNSVSPSNASVGDTITLRGVSFGSSKGSSDKVYFNDVEATNITKWGYTGAPGSSQGEINVVVPAGASSGKVKVVNNGIASNEKPFTINNGP